MGNIKHPANERWLDAFDHALTTHLTSDPSGDEDIKKRVIARLNRQRKLRIIMPLMAFLTALSIAGPQLWSALRGVSSALPVELVRTDISLETLASLALQVPIYAWLSAGLLLVFLEVGARQR